jgi:UDP-glucose 4-epimerase
MREKRVLVTGGAGFIGSHVVRELVAHDYIIDVVDDMSNGSLDALIGTTFRTAPAAMLDAFEEKHPEENRLPGSVLVVEGDFACVEIMQRAKSGRYGTIFHLAAQPRVQFSVENPFETNDVNVTRTLLLLEVIRGNGTKVVFSSSSAIYGEVEELPTSEFASSNPQSPYGLQKRMIEDYLTLFGRLYSQKSVCLRYFNVYGPGQDGKSPYSTAVAAWCSAIKEDRPLRSDGDGYQTRDLVYVGDVARANRLAAESNVPWAGHAFNIGSGKSLSNVEVLDLFKLKFQDLNIETAPARPGDVRDTLADISAAKKFIGFEPSVSFEEGLKNTFTWWDFNDASS